MIRVFEEATRRQIAFQKKGQVPVVDSIDYRNLEEVALGFGVSRDLLFQARRVLEIFEEDPAYRVETEDKILAGDVGLGAVIAGYAGRKATAGQGRNDRSTEILFRTGLRTLFLRASRFEDAAAIKAAIRQEVEQVEATELDTLEELATYVHATYADLMAEVADELREAVGRATGRGVAADRIAVDPGFGFGKRPEQNLQLLDRVGAVRALGDPIVLGPSAKRFLAAATGREGLSLSNRIIKPIISMDWMRWVIFSSHL